MILINNNKFAKGLLGLGKKTTKFADMNNTLEKIRTGIIAAILINLSLTLIADTLQHPNLTRTQITMRIPKTFWLNFTTDDITQHS